MIRTLINTTTFAITIDDMNGVSIDPLGQIDGLMFGEIVLKESADLVHEVMIGHIDIHDGTIRYSKEKAAALLAGVTEQLTRDGKRIITASDRPQDHFRHFTGAGDDMVNHIHGGGTPLIWEVNPPEDPEHMDAQFLEDIYLKDGHIKYGNAKLGSWFNVEIWVPPMIPFPASAGNGNTDIVPGQGIVANTTSTGKYWRSPVETLVNRFINKLPLLGNGEREALSAEPVLIPSPYILRCSIHNSSATETLELVLTLGLYRKQTI